MLSYQEKTKNLSEEIYLNLLFELGPHDLKIFHEACKGVTTGGLPLLQFTHHNLSDPLYLSLLGLNNQR